MKRAPFSLVPPLLLVWLGGVWYGWTGAAVTFILILLLALLLRKGGKR